MGENVTEALLSVQNTGHILNKMNFTHILLIPKLKDPQHMADYHPISLSNVVSCIVLKVSILDLETRFLEVFKTS